MDEVHDPPPSNGLIGYVIGQSGRTATYLHCSADHLLLSSNATFPEVFKAGKLFSISWSRGVDKPDFTELPATARAAYERRLECAFTVEGYEQSVLRSILLGARILAYKERCGIVISHEPLMISVPAQTENHRLTELHFLTDTGEQCSVKVLGVTKEHGRDLLLCAPNKPRGFLKNYSTVEFYTEGRTHKPPDTCVLEAVYHRDLPISLDSLDLLSRIYGPAQSFSFSRPPDGLVTIRYGERSITFDEQQSDVLWRYAHNQSFVAEGPPGSGKTLLVSAMAVSYCKSGVGGLQILLCPTESTLQALAAVLESLAPHGMKILSMSRNSAFSLSNGADKENCEAIGEIAHLQDLLSRSTSEHEAEVLRERLERAHEAPLAACERQNVVLATTQQILQLLVYGKPSRLKQQLQRAVSRVIIDHAEQVPEATLNALIIAFPGAHFAVLGDTEQPLPPDYTPGDLPSELAAAPTLHLLMTKGNLPVIKLHATYRSLLDTYHHLGVFYGDRVLGAPDPEEDEHVYELVLSSVCRNVTRNLVYLQLNGAQSQASGDSLISDFEMGVLEFAIRRLRQDGFDHDAVLVVVFHAAQLQLAKTRLPKEYEVVSVDEAQGREAPIVIVLTTSSEPNSDASLLCRRKAAAALSRQRNALLVLGTQQLTSMDPWSSVILPSFDRVILSPK